MREPPVDLAEEQIRACLRADYGLDVEALAFLPLGHDASASVYRAQAADGSTYFVKVRREVNNEAGLLVPRFLQDRGVSRVIAPLRTLTGALWTSIGTYALLLYPFVEGGTGKERGMSDRQWIAYGGVLRQIHDTAVSSDLADVMRRETFTPDGAEVLRWLDAEIGDREPDDPVSRALAASWQARRETIRTLLTRAEHLGQRVAQTATAPVLCHADIHTNNVLLDDADRDIWIVDWDDTMLAPRERDLMFVMGGGLSTRMVGPREERLFFEGYGAASIDPLAVRYYRYARAVSDMATCGEQVLLRPDLGSVTRRESVDDLLRLFAPGNIVSLALRDPG